MSRNLTALVMASAFIMQCLAWEHGYRPQPLEQEWDLGAETIPTTRGYFVRSVAPNSVAHRANLHRGDYIDSVNGTHVGYLEDASYSPLAEALNAADGNARLTVRYQTLIGEWRSFDTVANLTLSKDLKLPIDNESMKLDESQVRTSRAKEHLSMSH